EIEAELATDIKDLVRFEPGVSVRTSPARFGAALGSTGRDGNSGFNIRGLEGNRVLIQTDGVRLPDAYGFGPQVNGRGDYVDLDLLKSVEIIRGPASALYGSDGVAGAVSFITRDPDDLIKDGHAFGLRARSAYASADDSWANSLIGAAQTGDWSTMLAYTRRDGHELDNQGEVGGEGATRTEPNPTDNSSNSYLGKVVFSPGEHHRFRLIVDAMDSETDVNVLTGRQPAAPPYVTSATVDLRAHDTTARTRIAFDHTVDFGESFFKQAKWSLYNQKSETVQFTAEDRDPLADRTRSNTFDNDVWGVNTQVEGGFEAGASAHQLIFGADWSETTQDSIRDGTVPPYGETFPTRSFPLTDYMLAGVFVQDEISFLDGTLRFYPGLRYDSYELTPKPDALYPDGLPAAGSEDDRFSPKLGVAVDPTEWFGAFLNYASGYKAPSPSQVNAGFSNLAFGYTSIANPDLKPESSTSIEGGVRLRDVNWMGGSWSAGVTVFAADYEDFISQEVVGGSFTPTDPAIYQYVNLTDVSVTGAEARLDALWDSGWGVRVAASKSDGEVRASTSSALESIDPAKLVTGLTFDDPQGRFGGQLIATFVDGKDLRDVSSPALFRPPSFALLDLTAYWNVTDMLALRVGAFNLTDETYWWWGDVRGVTDTSVVNAYSQPGRNFSASLTFRY
ncbi:MAG: TonB-dependent hemoglobin/transferrin/lactoferrin family receptor, partial [Hyphomonadaceae bacterium]